MPTKQDPDLAAPVTAGAAVRLVPKQGDSTPAIGHPPQPRAHTQLGPGAGLTGATQTLRKSQSSRQSFPSAQIRDDPLALNMDSFATVGGGGGGGNSSSNRKYDEADSDTDELVDPVMQRQADSTLLDEDDPWATRAHASASPGRGARAAAAKNRLAPLRTAWRDGGHERNASSASDVPRTRRRQNGHSSSGDGSLGSWAAEEREDGFVAGANGNGKDAGSEWYSEVSRRRVGYEDLTTIDWIFEYTKERQRLRKLRSRASGLVGELQQLYDASQIWIVLVLTGLSAGLLAASIDIVSDWLGDLKIGYCHRGDGDGKFYLNKGFCCFGHEELAKCSDWTSWSTTMGVTSVAGRWMTSYVFYALYSVLFATSAALLVKVYAPYARQSGIPEIKTLLGGFVIQRFLSAWTLVTKSVGVVLSVSSGLWLGKEGPLVHISCCCADLWMRLWPSLYSNEARKREVLSAAASAGISVAFGAPVGGVLFSLEQLSYYFPDKTMWQSFVCAMVAAVTLQALNPFRSGKLVLYEVTYSSGWHSFEMLPFIVIGLAGGVFGAVFVKLNVLVSRWRRDSELLNRYPVVEVSAFALLTALINYPNVFMRAQSSELVYALFAECAAITDDQFGICDKEVAIAKISALLSAALLGLGLTAITFGLRLPAGIILPSMAMGALGGRALGQVVETIQERHPDWIFFAKCEPDIPCVTPGVYAVVGAAAALAGISRMTVSIVVIMFELTGALTYVLPIMIAVMLSKWVADGFGQAGIYESWINLNEYPYLGNPEEATIPDVYAAQVMTPIDDLATLSANGHTIASLHDFLALHPYRGFPIVGSQPENVLLGYITRTELTHALKLATNSEARLRPDTPVLFVHETPGANPSSSSVLDMRPWMDQMPITLNSRSTLQLTVDMFLRLGIKNMCFSDQGRLKGLLTKKDLWYILSHRGNLGVNDLTNTVEEHSRRDLEQDDHLFALAAPEDDEPMSP